MTVFVNPIAICARLAAASGPATATVARTSATMVEPAGIEKKVLALLPHPVRLQPRSPNARRVVRGKSCGDQPKEVASSISSWPGLVRPPTPWDSRDKVVDARIKSAQDEVPWRDRSRGVTTLGRHQPQS